VKVSLRATTRRCACCGCEFVAYAKKELCLPCASARAPGAAVRADGGPSTASVRIHKADFFGCRCELCISAGGITVRWSPHPNVALDEFERACLRTQFASWVNRWTRMFAAEHGLSVRPVSGEPDLLEPHR
jgi:hypothetical protein